MGKVGDEDGNAPPIGQDLDDEPRGVLKLLGQEREPDRTQQSCESHLARARTGTCFDAAGRTLMAN